MSRNKEMTAILRRAFLEGFKVSGEGWNGEYPYEGVPDAEIMDVLEEYFQRAFPVERQDEKSS